MNMMKLKRVILVHFHQYHMIELDFDQFTAFYGANGSGKSTFLDAIQVVMFGANENHINFNVRADDLNKSQRTFRSYCLGKFGDTDDFITRSRAFTYVTLVFEDETTHEPVSIGISITADVNDSKHRIEGRYILPGVGLTLKDHVESKGADNVPIEFHRFLPLLREKVKDAGYPTEEIIYNQAYRFINAYLKRLGIQQTWQAFVPAFRFAMNMGLGQSQSVDAILRNNVLEPKSYVNA